MVREQEFTPTQVKRLDLIAQLAAEALERAELHQRQERISIRERAESQLLQHAFLPRVLPQTGNLSLAAVYLPARDAPMGGDWYDAFPVDGGICLVIGDVAGHGVQSAAVMAQLRNAVRAFADEDPSPARVLTRLNRMMCRLEPGVTASAIVALWNESAGTILRSNAGHPPVLRCRVGEFGFLTPPPGGVILGARPHQEYVEETKVLRPGTTLLFYTDGLIENARPAPRRLYGRLALVCRGSSGSFATAGLRRGPRLAPHCCTPGGRCVCPGGPPRLTEFGGS